MVVKKRYFEKLAGSEYKITLFFFRPTSVKRKMESDLEIMNKKCQMVEQSLNEKVSEVNILKGQVKRLSVQAAKLRTGVRKVRPRLAPSKYSRAQRWRHKTTLQNEVIDALAFLGYENLEPVSVIVKNKNDQVEEIKTRTSPSTGCIETTEIPAEGVDDVNMLIYIKDKFCISDQAMHELCMMKKDFPRSRNLLQRIRDINATCDIKPCPEPIEGVQRSLSDSLPSAIRDLVSRASDDSVVKTDHVVRIKLSGDGTNIGKRLSVENFKPLAKAPPRLQRLMLSLQPYNLCVEYVPGKYMYLADTLSHAYIVGKSDQSLEDDMGKVIHSLITNTLVSTAKFAEIRDQTEQDKILVAIKDLILRGWPKSVKSIPSDLRCYWNIRHELYVAEGVIFFGDRIVIPKAVQQQMLRLIHESHLGMEKCKARARAVMYMAMYE